MAKWLAIGVLAAAVSQASAQESGAATKQAEVAAKRAEEAAQQAREAVRRAELAAIEARKAEAAAQVQSSQAFDQACADLLRGRTPPGDEKAIAALRSACSELMVARSEPAFQAAQRASAQRELAASPSESGTGSGSQDVQVEPGQATSAQKQGTGVLAAFGQAGSELFGPQRMKAPGMRSGGTPVDFTLTTDPVGYFTGLGVNAELVGSLGRVGVPKLSWIGGLRYSNTDTTAGTASTFGIEGGADYFLIGRNNEGLRLGPRVEGAFGRQSVTGDNFSWLGLSGELGYNFIATNGLTGLLGVGVGGRIAGDEQEDFSSFTGGEFGPYVKLGLGYSF